MVTVEPRSNSQGTDWRPQPFLLLCTSFSHDFPNAWKCETLHPPQFPFSCHCWNRLFFFKPFALRSESHGESYCWCHECLVHLHFLGLSFDSASFIFACHLYFTKLVHYGEGLDKEQYQFLYACPLSIPWLREDNLEPEALKQTIRRELEDVKTQMDQNCRGLQKFQDCLSTKGMIKGK